jgi:hypothetical protein
MESAGRFLAAERGAFDKPDAPPPQEPRIRQAATCPLWLAARIDWESLAQLSHFCGLTLDAFNERYE